jgi:hypothetical protein
MTKYHDRDIKIETEESPDEYIVFGHMGRRNYSDPNPLSLG